MTVVQYLVTAGPLTMGRLLLLLLLVAPALRGVRVGADPAGVVRPEQQQEGSEATEQQLGGREATEQQQEGCKVTEPPTWQQDTTTTSSLATIHPDLVTSWAETWLEMVVAVSEMFTSLVQPYGRHFPLDWQTTVSTVSSFIQRLDMINHPKRAIAVVVTTVSIPVLVQVTRWVLQSVVGLMDDTVFVARGQGLGRTALDHDMMKDISNVLLEIIHIVKRYLGL